MPPLCTNFVMDVVAAVQGYLERIVKEVAGMKVLLLDHETVH